MQMLKQVQARLAQLGFYDGVADGCDGPLTAAAVRRFQAAAGLVEDGIAGPATRARLFPEPVDADLGRDADPPGPEPATAPPVWPRQPEVERVFGPPGAHQTALAPPYPMVLAWQPDTAVTRFQVHERVHDSALRCLTRIADAYDAVTRADLGLDRFGGSLNVRPMRGGTRLSMHAWGIAIDFDPDRNQLRWGAERARLARPDAATFWRIWEAEGWMGLGRARNYDWMHVQAARL
jgi:hypothetical protein